MEERSNVYEAMIIFDSNRYARDPNCVSAQIPELITKLGGEVLVSRLWNEQKLAYPINGQRKGTYWLTYFSLDSSKLADFNVSSVTGGVDALGDVVIQLESDGLRVNGRGVSTDVVEASARAYLAAVNRMVRVRPLRVRRCTIGPAKS